ncbi:zinc ribbon domain-containing protein [Aurantiacibacter sp. D1-12]|uniref:zinc ribbon domain-containing protein n=1 Tax=Aurantiacibacter sp. D1-12 TaxID=2993658 RepID=UPI00237CEF90|nr:zinc ribbon domain-containing protein [Aurantiacibacter sp. D1-12]MDE1466120.1 zinc ribbon domain-containing protein [Aurantiacibacter sp. D1-12]
MRGFVCCGDCDYPMTSTWAKGRNDYYAYYMCRQRGCVSSKKSISRDRVEEELQDLVEGLTPAPELFELADAIFRDQWGKRAEASRLEATQNRVEIGSVEKQISKLIDRLVEAESTAVVSAYEAKVEKLERRKAALEEKVSKCGRSARGYDTTFQTALQLLSNPWNLWETGRLEDRRAMLRLVFGGHIKFHRENGFQTPEISLPFKALSDFSGHKEGMVPAAGVEPAA